MTTDVEILRKVIVKLMIQVEEEKRIRIETIQALTNLPLLKRYSVKVPTEEEIDKRIEELSKV